MKTCAPPDPDTRRPAFVPPPGACDSHCHVFGPAARFPYAPGRSYTPPDAGCEDFARLQAVLGLQRAVLVQASCHGTDNAAMLDAIARSGGRYRGVANIDDSFDEAALQALHDGGIRGIRFNFVKHLGGAPDLDRIRRCVARVAPLGWHLVLHFDAEDLPAYADFLAEVPVPVVIDHMARVKTADGLQQPAFKVLLEFNAGRREELGEDLRCGADLLRRPAVPRRGALRTGAAGAGAGRVLWGTDWPHPNISRWMPNDGDLVDLLPLYAPDPALQRRILVDNPARPLRFRRLRGFAD